VHQFLHFNAFLRQMNAMGPIRSSELHNFNQIPVFRLKTSFFV